MNPTGKTVPRGNDLAGGGETVLAGPRRDDLDSVAEQIGQISDHRGSELLVALHHEHMRPAHGQQSERFPHRRCDERDQHRADRAEHHADAGQVAGCDCAVANAIALGGVLTGSAIAREQATAITTAAIAGSRSIALDAARLTTDRDQQVGPWPSWRSRCS